MSYAGLILALISLVNSLFAWAHERKWIAEGEARQIAKASAEILRKTTYAKATADEIADLSDSQLDDLLQWLESGQPGNDRR
jgi:hypothetical protein